MSELVTLIQTYGVLIVFGIVLCQQIGLPLPSSPWLIVAGAMSVNGGANLWLCLLASVTAVLISDGFWFSAGRFYGKRILRLLCKISLSPDSCVSRTEDTFLRFGPNSLVVAKFIPGFSIVAPPLAGATGVTIPHFVALSALGGLLWSGTWLTLGFLFNDRVDQVLSFLQLMGGRALLVLGAALGGFVLYKYVQRRRRARINAVERISLKELNALIAAGHDPVIVDARSLTARGMEDGIPGALVYGECGPDRLMATLDKDRHIVVFCSCPNDVTAAQVAHQFLTHGFHRAKPLHGGLDAWNAAAANPVKAQAA
ncbi:DedA family protein/thiosulfate sulfurtransferase GlpE [Massilia sp. S19_KUP03_FR1]|uniref:DedA family protein/thiosulfate sulfurtransferase GlpE n=1 Tax=Massilia sp. S19_KUP03_FR1 TaxID=3025503 RepID=UPI002FCDBB3A